MKESVTDYEHEEERGKGLSAQSLSIHLLLWIFQSFTYKIFLSYQSLEFTFFLLFLFSVLFPLLHFCTSHTSCETLCLFTSVLLLFSLPVRKYVKWSLSGLVTYMLTALMPYQVILETSGLTVMNTLKEKKKRIEQLRRVGIRGRKDCCVSPVSKHILNIYHILSLYFM